MSLVVGEWNLFNLLNAAGEHSEDIPPGIIGRPDIQIRIQKRQVLYIKSGKEKEPPTSLLIRPQVR